MHGRIFHVQMRRLGGAGWTICCWQPGTIRDTESMHELTQELGASFILTLSLALETLKAARLSRLSGSSCRWEHHVFASICLGITIAKGSDTGCLSHCFLPRIPQYQQNVNLGSHHSSEEAQDNVWDNVTHKTYQVIQR